MARALSVVIDIGARIGASVGQSVGKLESMFGGLNRKLKVQAAETKLAAKEMRGTMGGFGELAALGGLSFAAKGIFANGIEYEHEIDRLRRVGRTAAETAQAVVTARKTVTDVPGSTMAGTVAMIDETTAAFGDYAHALANVGRNQKLALLLTNNLPEGAGGGEDQTQQIGALIRALEMRGAASNPRRYAEESDLAARAMMFTGGKVSGESFLNFASTASPNLKTLSNEYLYRIVPSLIQEMGADRAGTAQSAFANTILGKVGMGGASYAAEWMRLGLLDRSQAKVAKNGSVKGWNAGALTGTRLALENPLDWAERTLIPALTKAGVDINDKTAMQVELSKLFGKNTALRLATFLTDAGDRARLRRDEGLSAKTMSADDAFKDMARRDPKFALAEAASSLKNLEASIGKAITPGVVSGLNAFARGINWLAGVVDAHPGLGAGIATIGAALAGFAAVRLAGAVAGFLGLGTTLAEVGASLTAFGGWVAGVVEAAIMLGACFSLPAAAVVALGAAVVGVGVMIVRKWNGIVAFFRGFGEGFMAAIRPALPQLKAAGANLAIAFRPVTLLFGALGALIKPVLGLLAKFVEPAETKKWQGWGVAVGTAVGTVAGALIRLIELLTAAVKALAQFFGMASTLGHMKVPAPAPGQTFAPPTTMHGGLQAAGLAPGDPAIRPGARVGTTTVQIPGVGPVEVANGPGAKTGASAPSPQAGTTASAPAAKTGATVVRTMPGAAPVTLKGTRASGGPVSGGSAYRINERGEEMFIPGASGTVVDAKRTEALLAVLRGQYQAPEGRGETTVIHVGGITVQGADDPRATAREVMRQLERHSARSARAAYND